MTSRIKNLKQALADALHGKWEPLRKLIDGEESDVQNDGSNTKRSSRSEEFTVQVAKEINRVLEEEFVPNYVKKTAYVPPKFVVYFSASTDRMWSGTKREFLAEFLADVLLQQAKTMCASQSLSLTIPSIAVDIRVDGSLSNTDMRVRPISDVTGEITEFAATKPTRKIESTEVTEVDSGSQRPPKGKPLYVLEVVNPRSGREQIPIHKNEIMIGRGSQNTPVDIKLEGEPRISRIHSTLRIAGQTLSITARGTNPISVNGKTLSRGQTRKLKSGDTVQIYEFTLRCKLKRPSGQRKTQGTT